MSKDRHSQVYSVIRVDAIPPGVNHYVKHTRSGIHYIDAKAKRFKELLAVSCAGVSPVYGRTFEVEIDVSLGKGERGDVDGFPKLVLDVISRRGMLRNMKTGEPMSDAHVTRLTVTKERGEKSMTTIEIIGVNV